MRLELEPSKETCAPQAIVHLTASTFFGGPERQMLGLAQALPASYRTLFLSFAEGGRCQAFLAQAQKQGFAADGLFHDTPRLDRAVGELIQRVRQSHARVLCCHGYKAGLTGLMAARRVGIPVIAVSRGWTRENLKVRLYESLDRLLLRFMDRVVCISEGQAVKVRHAGVPSRKVIVIPNAVNVERFSRPDPEARAELLRYFPTAPALIVAAAGRLSPEKGFDILIRAAANIAPKLPSVSFIVFGDGPLRDALADQIAASGLEGRFVLAGFRGDLDRLFPHFDLLALSSYTEGLPNVILEAFAAGVPVVATAVGGTPEVIEQGISGYLVAAGDVAQLAGRIEEVMSSERLRTSMGEQGKQRVCSRFTFASQARGYVELFERLSPRRRVLDAASAISRV